MAVSTDGIMRYLTIGGATYEVYDTTYNEATNSTAGLMSVADKLKLDSITVSDIGTVGADSIRGEKNISVSITDGVATIGHSNTAVTSSNTQPSKNNSASSSTALGFGDIIQFPYVTYDTYGHVTQKNIVAFQLPIAPSSTDTATNATNATYATYDASEVNKTTKTTIADKFILKSVGTTKGDIIYYSGTTPAPTRLAIGSEGQVLKVGSNGIPVWGADSNDNSYHTSGSWSGVTYTATANGGAGELKFTLPTASASASGIINTDTQSFKGDKTFQSNTFRIRNANNDNNQAGSNPWVTQLNLGDGNYVTVTEYKDDHMTLRGSSILLNTASAFSVYDATKTYSVGNIVWYEKAYYRCTTAITTAEAWTAEHWTAMPTSGIMANANLNPWITDTYSLGTSSYKWNNIYTNSINGTVVPSISQQTTQAVYPIKINAIGQITGYGSAVTIPTIPSNNVTGSGTSGYLVKWNGANSITNGPQLGSSTTTYLRNDGSWATPTDTNTTYSLSGALSSHKFTSTLTAGGSGSGTSTSDFTLAAGTGITLTDNTSTRTITIASSVTNTDTLVTQTNTTGNAEYRLLFSANANDSDETTTARKSTYLRYNPNLKALVSSGEIRAEKGVFNKLIATDFTASTASIDSLTATNAKVIGLLDVEGDLHTNKWTNANIANVGGSFYISPTVSSTSTNAMSVTITGSANSRSLQVSGGTFETDVAKIYDSTNNSTHSVYSTGTTSGWPVGSHVMITGNIRSTTTGVDYPLGTLTGYLTAALSSSGFTVVEVNSNALESIISEIGTSNLKSYEISISMIEIGPKTSLKPIGIMMTSYGVDKSTYIDIYGGVRTDGKSNPNVRVGYLGGLPQVNNETPKGWGIYTDNGYFTGVIVSTAGKIGNWTIENTTSSSPTYGGALYTGSFGTDNGIFITPSYASSTQIGGSSGTKYWTLTASNKFGVTKTGELYANAAHIIGSIDATSFVARDSNGKARAVVNDNGLTINDTSESPVAQFAASGVTFNSSKAVTIGNQNASISFNPANGGSINITGTQVNFGAPVIQQITENIDIGGRNLLAIREYIPSVAETTEIDSEGWVSDIDDPTQDTRTWSYDGSNWQLSLEAGEYILSWETKVVTTNSNAGIRLYTNNNDTNVQIFAIDSTAFTTLGKQTYVFQLSEPAHIGNEEDYDSTNKVGLMFKLYNGSARFQLEKGNVPTDWRPATDDLATTTSLETVTSGLNGAKDEITILQNENTLRQKDIKDLGDDIDGKLQANREMADNFITEQVAINNQVVPVIQNIAKGIRIEPETPSITVFTSKVEDNVEKQSYVMVTDARVEIVTSSSRATAYADSESFNAQSGVFENLFPQRYATGERNLVFQARANGHFSLKQVK